MGSNKRYGSDVSEEAINELLLRPCPISLSAAEIGADPTTTPHAPAPVPVTAWVRFPEAAVRVKAHAIAWTDRAVEVEFTLRDGRSLRSWVWRGAVTQRPGGKT
ncbi:MULTISPECIES: hypothetical protein [unclassified Microbacterium]|uniref:hypothetical protein n=1 Tax=unclassified Microbacterium TaxID=2609290 RepID=UPI00301A47CC